MLACCRLFNAAKKLVLARWPASVSVDLVTVSSAVLSSKSGAGRDVILSWRIPVLGLALGVVWSESSDSLNSVRTSTKRFSIASRFKALFFCANRSLVGAVV